MHNGCKQNRHGSEGGKLVKTRRNLITLAVAAIPTVPRARNAFKEGVNHKLRNHFLGGGKVIYISITLNIDLLLWQ